MSVSEHNTTPQNHSHMPSDMNLSQLEGNSSVDNSNREGGFNRVVKLDKQMLG